MTSGEGAASGAFPSSFPRWLAALGGSLALFLVAVVIAPWIPMDPHTSFVAAVAGYSIAFAGVGSMTIATGALVPAIGPRALFAVAPISIAIGALAVVGIPAGAGLLSIAGSATVVVLLLAGGSLAGAVVGTRIQHAGHLVVVAFASSIADAWSVLSPEGPSAAVAEQAPLLSALALPFPMIGTHAIEPLLGVGDVVFVALYLSASRRFGLGVGRSAAALALALAVTAATVLALERAIPALPFLGAAMLIAHPAARLPPAHERRSAVIGLGLLAALALAALVLR